MIPEIMVKTPMPTPKAMEIWYGLRRREPVDESGVACVVSMSISR
jgi:hypothetical protein